MEYYEGASYRINIEGYDSTLILDGYTRTLKANLIDQNDNMMVDHETGTLYGTLVGSIVDSESNIVYDNETKTITVEQIQGSLINTHGDIVYDHYQSIFKGDFVGNFSGNILSGDNIVYDQATNVLNASLFGSIMTAEGGIAYDHERNIFQGTFVGNFLDQDGNLIFSSSEGSQNFVDDQILHKDGTVAIDLTSKVFSGSIWGNVVTHDGYVLLNVENETLYGNLSGNVEYRDGTTAVDIDTKTLKGSFVGNIYNDDGNLIIDSETSLVNANLVGNVLSADGSIIVDTSTELFSGTLSGSLAGNILNRDGQMIFDNELATFHVPVQVDIVGSLLGDVIDSDGALIIDSVERAANFSSVNADAIVGSLYNLSGELILDVDTNQFAGSLVGNILNSDGLVVFDTQNAVFKMPIQADVVGSLLGHLIDADGAVIIDNVDKIANLNILNVSEINSGTIVGTLSGDVVNSSGEIVIDSESLQFAGSLIGDIIDANGRLAYDSTTNTFNGNFVGTFTSTNAVSIKDLIIGDTLSGSLSVYNNADIEDDYGPFSVFSFKNSNQYSGITLTKSRGSVGNALAVQAGDRLNAILFSAQTGSEQNNKSPVALIGAKVPDDAIVSTEGIPGEVALIVNGYDNELVEGFVVDANGHMKTTLKELSIVGSTNNTPNNTTTKSKWLELKVNGEVMFIPLYS